MGQDDCIRSTIKQPDPDVILQPQLVKYSPWHMLVGCVMLNLTKREQVDDMIVDFFDTFSSPLRTFGDNNRAHMRQKLGPLGLSSRRSKTIQKMSAEYMEQLADRGFDQTDLYPIKMHGCGLYAQQSYEIFVQGQYPPPSMVTDHVLKDYLEANVVGYTPVPSTSKGGGSH